MKIVIIGPKCSGKSSIGKLLAEEISFTFFETDEIIEQLFKKEMGKPLSCRAICSEYGEDFFRNYERRAVKQIAEKDTCIISTGGSALLNKESRELLRKSSVFVLLYASNSVLLERVSKEGVPAFLNGKKNSKELFITRANLVIETLKPFADIVIDTSGLNIEKTFNILLNKLRNFSDSSSMMFEKKILSLVKDDYAKMLKSCKSALESSSGFILVPTETVYGLACLWDNATAKSCIYQVKARPEHKPFQMLVNSIEMAKNYGCIIDSRIEKIVNAFCPGPITIVVLARDGSKIGFRIPDHKFVFDLISYIGKPLAATSANISGEKPALNIKDVLSTIKIQPVLAIDGGKLPESSLASTVIEFADSYIKLLRQGAIPFLAVLKVLE